MKNFKYYFLRSLPIIFVIVVIVTFVMLFKMQAKVDEMYEYNEDEEVVNTINEVKNTSVENLNTVENEIVKNEVTNTSNVTVIEKNPSTMTEEEKEEINTEDNKVKAVNMVKAKYDYANSGMVYFFDSVLSTGEFVVASKVSNSSTISAYYKVNITTGDASIMY